MHTAPKVNPPNPVEHLEQILHSVLQGLSPSIAAPSLQPAKDRKFGDIALPCFPLAKVLQEAPPAISARIADEFTPDHVIEAAVATGPFVNFKFRRDALAKYIVHGVLENRAPFGPSAPNGKSIVIDFSSPNIAKPFHMGHLRSTVIGGALRRIHIHLGSEVHGINHLGDWGSQFGKIMTAFRRWGSDEKLASAPMQHLFEIYVRYGQEKNDELEAESAENFRRLESGEDNAERQLWQRLRDVSLTAFQGPYERLGVEFDHVTGESFYEDKMEAAITRVTDAGILTESEGAQVVEFTNNKKMPPCILRKSDGTTIYATRDLAAIFYRVAEYKFDRALYVVGGEQKLHFEQLKAVLRKMGMPEAESVEHVPFGLILSKDEGTGKWGKFSTRGGNAIFLDEVLDEAVAIVREIIAEKNPDLENPEDIAEKVGVSAIIFNDLKNSRIKDVKFDWEQLLSFEGETGPYVQYAVARLSGILRKAEAKDDIELEDLDFGLLTDADQVLLTMLDFGPTVQRAAAQNEPSVITNQMIQLAGDIHSYLRDHHVIRADAELKRARLALVAAARKLLKTGLELLGVSAPDRM